MERRKAVEFSFFTLADSGAFVTHAPKYLNEALALVRPFHWEVWPILMITVALIGPAIYFVIMIPFWWRKKYVMLGRDHNPVRFKRRALRRENELVVSSHGVFNVVYLKEMSYGVKDVVAMNHWNKQMSLKCQYEDEIPKKLLNKCIWFTITLFLRQCMIC